MSGRRKVRVLDTGGCTTRCLPPEAVQAGREQLGEGEARRVPFVCQISGDPSAAVLVGEEAAERILRDAGLGLLRGRTEAYALAGLAEATLCACDVATLLGRPQPEVEAVLRSLAEAGLTEERPLRGMPYFGLTPRGRRVLERALRTSSSGQAPPRREARDED